MADHHRQAQDTDHTHVGAWRRRKAVFVAFFLLGMLVFWIALLFQPPYRPGLMIGSASVLLLLPAVLLRCPACGKSCGPRNQSCGSCGATLKQ